MCFPAGQARRLSQAVTYKRACFWPLSCPAGCFVVGSAPSAVVAVLPALGGLLLCSLEMAWHLFARFGAISGLLAVFQSHLSSCELVETQTLGFVMLSAVKWQQATLMLGQPGFMFCDCTFVISIMFCFVKIFIIPPGVDTESGWVCLPLKAVLF